MRANKRANDQLRPVSLEKNIQPQADASLLIRMGNTHVICAVSVEEKVPPFLRDSGQGWITAEYGMLPGATNTRFRREINGRGGRTYEIQRLIGRSLRMMVDLKALGERTLRVDCDVLNADGGTRTASISGAAIALGDAITGLHEKGMIEKIPDILPVAAISAGIIDGEARLDLDYEEDSSAEVDANFVMSGKGGLIEVQCTAEVVPFDREKLDEMTDLAWKGISELFTWWDK